MALSQGVIAKAGANSEHHPVSGPFTDLLNKLRADLIAGKPPAQPTPYADSQAPAVGR